MGKWTSKATRLSIRLNDNDHDSHRNERKNDSRQDLSTIVSNDIDQSSPRDRLDSPHGRATSIGGVNNQVSSWR